MFWNAWSKGYKIGVIASSDHFSTHISYAMVYTPDTSREAIHDSIRKRRTYGATDNIVLDFRMGDAFMGGETAASEPQRVTVRVRGTDAVAAVHLIRDRELRLQGRAGQAGGRVRLPRCRSPARRPLVLRAGRAGDGELAWSQPDLDFPAALGFRFARPLRARPREPIAGRGDRAGACSALGRESRSP